MIKETVKSPKMPKEKETIEAMVASVTISMD
jgi:hypothetical protein